MNKAFLSTSKRYGALIFFVFCFIFIGQILMKAYNTSPEKHFIIGLNLIKSDAFNASTHLKLATQSKNKSIQEIAYLSLARLYHHGATGISQNIPKAISYYEKAVSQPEALYLLALFYDAGDKVPENKEKAMRYIKKAAQSYAPAQYALAVWMERGYLGKVEMSEIVQLYTQAAQKGIKNAMKSLISIYHGGFSGFPQNLQMENYWRTKLNQGF